MLGVCPCFNFDVSLSVCGAEEAYVETDAAYLVQDEVAHNDDGCTATTAVLLGQRLVLAHVVSPFPPFSKIVPGAVFR